MSEVELTCVECGTVLDVDIDDSFPPRSVYTDRTSQADPTVCWVSLGKHQPDPSNPGL